MFRPFIARAGSSQIPDNKKPSGQNQPAEPQIVKQIRQIVEARLGKLLLSGFQTRGENDTHAVTAGD